MTTSSEMGNDRDVAVHASEDYGVTAHEQREREPLAARLAREAPDVVRQAAGHPIPEPDTPPRVPAWNVIVTVRSEHFREAIDVLAQYGSVAATRFYNVLTMRVDDPGAFLDEVRELFARDAPARDAMSRVLPLQHTFTFRTADEFERAVAATTLEWVDDLAEARFHVRIHRRGAEGVLDVTDEEALIGEIVLDALETAGTTAHVAFDDVDAVIDIETLDSEGGMSLWTRDDLTDYPFLRVT